METHMQKHVAFFILPNHPHLGPTLPIVSVMTRRGYRVSYATTTRFAARVQAAGAECTIYDPEDLRISQTDGLSGLIAGQLTVFSRIYEHDLPDLVIYDEWGFAGYILARRHNVPAIYAGPSYALDRHCLEIQIPHERQRRNFLDFSASVDRALLDFDAPDADWYFHRAPLNIFLCPKTLQPCSELLDDNCYFAGRCAGEQLYYGEWTKKSGADRPYVLVATSTNYIQGPQYFNTCIEALDGLGYHVLLSIGDDADPSQLPQLPRDFEIVQHVSHVKLLPYVALYVGCGGIISSAEAAYYRTPMILTSLGFPEKEWEAENLRRVGLAAHLSGNELTPQLLRQKVQKVAEDASMHYRVREISEMVRREPGGEDAVNRIEQHLNW